MQINRIPNDGLLAIRTEFLQSTGAFRAPADKTQATPVMRKNPADLENIGR